MAGYIGSKSSVTQVDGYNQAEADAEFVNDPNSVITVSGSNVGIGTTSPTSYAVYGYGPSIELSGGYGGSVIVSDTSQTNKTVLTHFGSSGEGILKTTTSKSLHFSTNDSEPMMTLDSSGNVGIGTSSPTADLHLGGTNPNLVFGTSGNELTYLQRYNDDFYIFNKETAGNILFGTANSERMRIDSSGKVIIGTEPDNTYSQGWSSIDGVQDSSRDSTASRTHYTFRNPNGSVGTIQTNGSSTSFNTSSDYRLKTDAQPMTGASARVQALNPVNFEWIADGTRVDGFLAHEAQEVVPEAVHGTKDAMRDEEYEVTPAVLDDDGNVVTEAVMGTRSVPDYQGIDQSKLVPLLTAALQEALTEISDLKARVTALEAV